MIRWFLALALIIGLALVALSLVSRKQPKTGLIDGRLKACPDTPNCVCSEDAGKASFVKPLTFSDTPERAWRDLEEVVGEIGGKIEKEENGYLWATFTTKLFRFVDDVELRINAKNGVIHIRSASRVGYSDMGANRKRIENLRDKLQKKDDGK
jgi:uncharacterized protein (DUF1499 family)